MEILFKNVPRDNANIAIMVNAEDLRGRHSPQACPGSGVHGLLGPKGLIKILKLK
jgi:hypothetical protein